MADGDPPSAAPEAADGPVKVGRRQDGTWPPGVSGNPNGNRRGARHRATQAIESLLQGEVEGLTRRAIEMGLAGDTTALRLCLERLAPARKDSTLQFGLPKLETPQDAMQATAAIAEAVSNGELTPSEASELARVVDAFVRSVEAYDLAKRITRLEGLDPNDDGA